MNILLMGDATLKTSMYDTIVSIEWTVSQQQRNGNVWLSSALTEEPFEPLMRGPSVLVCLFERGHVMSFQHDIWIVRHLVNIAHSWPNICDF